MLFESKGKIKDMEDINFCSFWNCFVFADLLDKNKLMALVLYSG